VVKLFLRPKAHQQAGWRAVFSEQEETGEDKTGNLPEVSQGETLPVIQSELLKKQTKPKLLYTEVSLPGAMESAGKDVTNEAEREAMRENGIGIPAICAAIIETFFACDYIRREKKLLVSTDKGLSVCETVKDNRIAGNKNCCCRRKYLPLSEVQNRTGMFLSQGSEMYGRKLRTGCFP
jgi:DNA topoisomerase-3